jgi:glycosyltransferase involved in cell wall biosynthesis
MAGSKRCKIVKIAFIHPSNPFEESTGATYSANKIAEELSKKGHELTVYCVNQAEETTEVPYETEILISGDKPHRSRTSRLNKELLGRKDEFEKFDLLYSYRLDNLLSLSKLGEDISTKIVVTLNSYGGICPTHTLMYREEHHELGSNNCLKCIMNKTSKELRDNGFKQIFQLPKVFTRRMIRLRRIRKSSSFIDNIDRFHAVSEHVKDSYVEAGFPEDKIKVTPSILDEKFLVDHESSFEQPYTLLFVGYLKKHKGAGLLIPIMNELTEKTDKEFKLNIVGSGPLEEKIERQIQESPVSDRIELKGRIPNSELPEFYASHDLFVNPVKWEEPWGRVFLESLSAGTPIISNEIENAKALPGVVTTENSPETFADKLANILNKERLEKLSQEGKENVRKYTAENTVATINKSLTEIINNTR